MFALLIINTLFYSYLLLFFWSFLAATLLPGTSEFYLIYLVQQENTIWLPVLIATIGNSLGGVSTYYLGYFGRKYYDIKKEKSVFENNSKALQLVEKYGAFILILSWVPLMGDVLVGLAGVVKLNKTTSFFWMTLGKFLRYLLLALSTLGIIELLK